MELKQALGFGGLDLIPTSRWETHGRFRGGVLWRSFFFFGGAFFGFATLGTEIERTNTVGN